MNDAHSIMKFNSIDILFETKITKIKKNNGDSKPMNEPHIDNNQKILFFQSETERTNKSILKKKLSIQKQINDRLTKEINKSKRKTKIKK